jgi:hypothetical protein
MVTFYPFTNVIDGKTTPFCCCFLHVLYFFSLTWPIVRQDVMSCIQNGTLFRLPEYVKVDPSSCVMSASESDCCIRAPPFDRREHGKETLRNCELRSLGSRQGANTLMLPKTGQ